MKGMIGKVVQVNAIASILLVSAQAAADAGATQDPGQRADRKGHVTSSLATTMNSYRSAAAPNSGFKWGSASRQAVTAAEVDWQTPASNADRGFKWGSQRSSDAENASYASDTSFMWTTSNFSKQSGFRWGVRSYSEQSGFRWGVRNNPEQSGFRWGVRSSFEQVGFRWGVRSYSDQSGFRWGVRNTLEQSGFRWGVRHDPSANR